MPCQKSLSMKTKRWRQIAFCRRNKWTSFFQIGIFRCLDYIFFMFKVTQFDIFKCCRYHRKAFQDFSSWIKNMIVQDNFHAISGDLLITTLPILSQFDMMTSSNGNIFRVTGPLCGEFTVPVISPHKGQWRGALMYSLICVWINGWVNNREAGDLRRYRGHYDVIVMTGLSTANKFKPRLPAQWAIATHHKGSSRMKT